MYPNVCYNYTKMVATSIEEKSNRNVPNIIGGRSLKKDLWNNILKFICNEILVNSLMHHGKLQEFLCY